MGVRLTFYLSVLFFGIGVFQDAFASTTYTVRAGDSLSKIAGKSISGPAWGDKGGLRRILALNPKIMDPDKIHIGQKINLPPEATLAALGVKTQTETDLLLPAHLEELPKNSCQYEKCTVGRKIASVENTELQGHEISAETPQRKALFNFEGLNPTVLEIAPYYALSDMSASDKTTGSPAELPSSLNIGVDVRYSYPWTESFSTYFHVRLGDLSMNTPDGFTVKNASNFMSSLGLGANFNFHFFHLTIFVSDQQEAFLIANAVGSASITAAAVPEIGAKLDVDIFHTSRLTLGISGQYSELLSSSTQNFKIALGNSYGGTIYAKEPLGSAGQSLKEEFGYLSRQQNTNLTNQIQTDLFLQVGFIFQPTSGTKK